MMNDNVNFSGGEQIYTTNNKNISVIKTYRNDFCWDLYSIFDDNKNQILEASEISELSKKIEEYAGTDKILDTNELKEMSQKLGVSENVIMSGIKMLSADIIANNMVEEFHPGAFKKIDKNAVTSLIKKINNNNVSEIWEEYQTKTDDKFTAFSLVLYKDTSLAKDILDNFSFEEAKPMLKNIVRAMVTVAKDKKIGVNTLILKFNEGIRTQDSKKIDAAMREMAMRLNFATRMSMAADYHAKEYQATELTEENGNKAKALAKKYNIVYTKDLTSDGILGNTPSKVVNKDVQTIYNVVQELLKNPETKEQICANIRKENNCIVTNFPRRAEDFTLSDNTLVSEGVLENSVIGDGDMSHLIFSIKWVMEQENFKKTNDTKAVKEFILDIFNPRIFGLTRRYALTR